MQINIQQDGSSYRYLAMQLTETVLQEAEGI